MVSRVRLETVGTGSLHRPDFQGAVKVNASDKKKLTPKRGALGRRTHQLRTLSILLWNHFTTPFKDREAELVVGSLNRISNPPCPVWWEQCVSLETGGGEERESSLLFQNKTQHTQSSVHGRGHCEKALEKLISEENYPKQTSESTAFSRQRY